MSKITLSMIIKNEEKYLEDCLRSVENAVDEIVIVDTGSTDRSLEIAKRFNANIFHFGWINDFSAARNFALQNSTGNWILYLDADERLTSASIDIIKELTSENKNLGINCVVNSIDEIGGTPSIMNYVRLFRNLEGVKFEGKVHEQIESSLRKQNCEIINSEIEIIHLGYNISQDELKVKAKRNLDLLVHDYVHSPNGYKAFHIGQSLVTLNELENSLEYFLVAAEDINLEKNHRAHACRYLAAIYNDYKSLDGAKAYVERGLEISKDVILLNLVASKVYLSLNEAEKADYHSRRAYELNSQYNSKENQTYFDILVDSIKLVLHGLNIGLYSNNAGLYNYFAGCDELSQLNENQINIITFLGILLNQKPVDENSLGLISETIKEYNSKVIINLLNSYKLEEDKHTVIKELYKYYKDDLDYLNYFGSFSIHINDLRQAISAFAGILKINPGHKQAILQLINLYTQLNEFEKLKVVLDNAESVFADDTEIGQRISAIKNRLS
ncbi:MAG: glycosyltransferase [Melioribacteraceae bacterium]|nr:glycosyltransferase [Melioribacteraceae bacterium]